MSQVVEGVDRPHLADPAPTTEELQRSAGRLLAGQRDPDEDGAWFESILWVGTCDARSREPDITAEELLHPRCHGRYGLERDDRTLRQTEHRELDRRLVGDEPPREPRAG